MSFTDSYFFYFDALSSEKFMERTLTNTLEYKSLITFRSSHWIEFKETFSLKPPMTYSNLVKCIFMDEVKQLLFLYTGSLWNLETVNLHFYFHNNVIWVSSIRIYFLLLHLLWLKFYYRKLSLLEESLLNFILTRELISPGL